MKKNHKREIQTARNWYRWLWLSPFFTITTASVLFLRQYGLDLICGGRDVYSFSGCNFELAGKLSLVIGLGGSALWHLVLLVPALTTQSKFVRWHGRQALLLAGVRTVIPLGLALWFGMDEGNIYISAVIVLLVVWFFGTKWAQSQAKNGKCSLAHWFGQDVSLLLPESAQAASNLPIEFVDTARELVLMNDIQYTVDQNRFASALRELHSLGLSATMFGLIHSSGQDEWISMEVTLAVHVIQKSESQRNRSSAVRILENIDGLVEPI